MLKSDRESNIDSDSFEPCNSLITYQNQSHNGSETLTQMCAWPTGSPNGSKQ